MRIRVSIFMLVTTLAALLSLSAAAQSVPVRDTLVVFFRVGQGDLDLNYVGNRARLQEFTRRIRAEHEKAPNAFLQVDVFAGASPEGTPEMNYRLAEQRGNAMRQAVLDWVPDLPVRVEINNLGPRWDDLYKMVAASNAPWKEDVLKILRDKPAMAEWKTNKRMDRIRKLRGGSVWKELQKDYLPPLRSTGSAVLAMRRADDHRVDTLYIQNLCSYADSCFRQDFYSLKDTVAYLSEITWDLRYQKRNYVARDMKWALKTNTLLYLAAAPNIQLEIPVSKDKHWSVEAGVTVPFWRWANNTKARQLLDWSVTGRYYVGNRTRVSTLQGFHIGAGVSGGYYDLEWNASDGHQGEYFRVMMDIGYQFRFGEKKNWCIDTGVGLGYIGTKYRHYLGSSIYPPGWEEPRDNHLMWQSNGTANWVGPVNIYFSIGYMLDCYNWFKKK